MEEDKTINVTSEQQKETSKSKKNEAKNLLEIRIKELEDNNEDLSDRLLRSIAEAENIRRRYEKQLEETRDYAIVNFAKDIIGFMDNLHRAIEHKPKNPSPELLSLFTVIEMSANELNNVMVKHNIVKVEPKEGDKFDYNNHHALSHVESVSHDVGSIVGVMQYGYRLKDRLLRPAIVSVAKKPGNE